MLHLLATMAGTPGWPSREVVALAACDCAELAQAYWSGSELERAIQTVRSWAIGTATIADVRKAAEAARRVSIAIGARCNDADATADWYAANAAAWYAANAAAWAAHYAADNFWETVDDAADGVALAADEAADACASETASTEPYDENYDSVQRECAQLVRLRVPSIPEIPVRGI